MTSPRHLFEHAVPAPRPGPSDHGGAAAVALAVAPRPGAAWRRWLAAVAAQPRWQVLGWAFGSLLLAALACALLPLDQVMDQRHDWQAEALAPAGSAPTSVVVDVDEAALKALGHWPLPRQTYVPVAQWLQAQGARAIVFGMLMVDPREGDAELGRWLATAQVPVLVGARSLPPPPLAPQTGQQAAPAGCLPHPVAAWQLPVWAAQDTGQPPAAVAGAAPDAAARAATPGAASLPLLPLARLGALSTPVDGDGRLRSWPLWQQAGNLALPSMPVAVWQALHATDAAGLHCRQAEPWGESQARWSAGKPWPTDGQGRVRPWLPPADRGVPTVSMAQVAAAASGRLAQADQDRLAAQVRGRVVFIGASAQTMGEQVLTGQGWREPTALLAASFDALEQGHLLVPPRVGTSLALMAWLCLPVLVALWVVRPGPGTAAARLPAPRRAAEAVLIALGLAMVGLAVSDWLLVAQAGQLSRLAWPVVSLLFMTGSALWWWRHRAVRERLALHAARTEAQALARIKSEFLAQVSHEVRTPLNALLGAAEMLEATPLTPEQRRHVLLFNGAGHELLGMLNDLLDLSKSEAGQLTLQRQPFSLTQLVAQQMALFEATLAHKGLALLTEADPDLPDVVLGDGPRVAQVLRNLLSNAVKFTSVGSITLDLRFGRSRDHVRIEVRDTGIGVPADRLHQLFSPYTQAHDLASRRQGGTGLGLAISRRLVELMGGTIGVDSREGLGARFHFELPLPATTATPQDIQPPATSTRPAADLLVAHARGDGKRVLVADDSVLNLVLARSLLEAAGYLVDTATDGAAAVRQFEARAYDVVLLDLNMPVMDGYAAAQALREFERRRGRAATRVLAVSGQVDPQDVAAAHEAGFDAHLAKPYTRVQLLQLVAGLVPGEDQPAQQTPVASAANSSWIDVMSRLPDAEPAAAVSRLGSPQLYERVLEAARDPLLHFEPRLAAALGASPADGSTAHRLSHNLKTLAATIGLPGLSRDAARLERALATAEQPAQDEAVRLAREQVQRRLHTVRQALQAHAAAQAEPARRAVGGGL